MSDHLDETDRIERGPVGRVLDAALDRVEPELLAGMRHHRRVRFKPGAVPAGVLKPGLQEAGRCADIENPSRGPVPGE
jgi:hypothetical protein